MILFWLCLCTAGQGSGNDPTAGQGFGNDPTAGQGSGKDPTQQ